METYNLWMLLAGLSCFGAAWLPYLLHRRSLSFPMVYVGAGVVLFSLPLGLPDPDPIAHSDIAERITELVVIVSLMGVGLKLERPIGWGRWGPAWRLLGVTMLLCIATFAFVGWWAVGLVPASALLLGAVMAPTDPVLAAAVQADPPMEEEGPLHFALTAEAGLNDGLAFPFTYLALAVAASGLAPEAWLGDWLLMDVLYKIAVGVVIGAALGYTGAWVVFQIPIEEKLAQTGEGLVAVAITLFVYGVTELAHGYGFIAVFAAGLSLRRYERENDYHRELHDFTDSLERILMAFVLILFGGALASGLLGHLTWPAALAAVAFVLLVRPLAGLIGLAGLDLSWAKKATVAFFGIRGVGSFYYLTYGLNEADPAGFPESELVWAIVGLAVLLSVVVHGAAAPWAVGYFEALEEPRPAAEASA